MEYKDIIFSLVLSQRQADYLASSKYGIDRMKALTSLVSLASIEDTDYRVKGFETNVRIGQVVISEVELSRKWGCDRKTASRLLDQMNKLGMISTEPTNRTSIHTILCIAGWIVDGQYVSNPFFKKTQERLGIGDLTKDLIHNPLEAGQGIPSDIDGGCSDGSERMLAGNFSSCKASERNIAGSPSKSAIYDNVEENAVTSNPLLADEITRRGQKDTSSSFQSPTESDLLGRDSSHSVTNSEHRHHTMADVKQNSQNRKG